MTDDISAAKHYRQAIATVCEGFTLPDAARKVLETALWNPPTESATTPAEVELPEPAFHGQGADCDHLDYYTADQMREYAATLARQLAEAKERMRELEAQRDDYLNREWAAEKAKRKAESQLAEATRRLGEVEIDAARWQRWLPWLMQLNKKPFNLAKELDAIAALTKEPTK